MRRHQRYTSSQVVCIHCETPFPLWRQSARRKSPGHIKDLWCVTCRAVTPHRERDAFGRDATPEDS